MHCRILVASRLLQVLPGPCQIAFLSQNRGGVQVDQPKPRLQTDSFQKLIQRRITLAQPG